MLGREGVETSCNSWRRHVRVERLCDVCTWRGHVTYPRVERSCDVSSRGDALGTPCTVSELGGSFHTPTCSLAPRADDRALLETREAEFALDTTKPSKLNADTNGVCELSLPHPLRLPYPVTDDWQ